MQYNYDVLCQWQKNLQRLPLSPPGKSAVFHSEGTPFRVPFYFLKGGRGVCHKGRDKLGTFHTAQPDHDNIIANYQGYPMVSIVTFPCSIPAHIKLSIRILQCRLDPIDSFRPLNGKCVFYLIASGALVKTMTEPVLPKSYSNLIKRNDGFTAVNPFIMSTIFINGLVLHKRRIGQITNLLADLS